MDDVQAPASGPGAVVLQPGAAPVDTWCVMSTRRVTSAWGTRIRLGVLPGCLGLCVAYAGTDRPGLFSSLGSNESASSCPPPFAVGTTLTVAELVDLRARLARVIPPGSQPI